MDRLILERLLSGRGVKKICGELKVGKARVREVRTKAVDAGYLDIRGKSVGAVPVPATPAILFPNYIDRRTLRTSGTDQLLLSVRSWIEEHMIAGWTLVTIFEELPVKGISRSGFYRFLERHDLYKVIKYQKDSLIAPIIHKPGEALILDWGKVRDVIDPETNKKHTLWAFVGVMGFSRYMMVRLVWTNSVPVTLDAMESMFQELGGIPTRMTSDNPKCFSIKADKYDPLLNPALERFAEYYQFRIECLAPYEPKKKGKIERMVPFVRRLFEAYPKEFVSIEHAQVYINNKCNMANERRHGTTCLKPIEEFQTKELKCLKALPVVAYEREEVAYPLVRKDGFVRFDSKYYAVGDSFIGKPVVVVGTTSRVSIFIDGKLVETYDRIISPDKTHAIQEHLKKPWQKFEENCAHYLSRADLIGPGCGQFVRDVLERGDGFVDIRIVWGVLALDKKYDPTAIDQACRTACEAGRLSSRYVADLLLIDSNSKLFGSKFVDPKDRPLSPIQQTFKFARPMSVYIERVNQQAQPGLAVSLNQQEQQAISQ
jgi:hypothetical protein